MATPVIETEGLTKHYGSVLALTGLDLSVESGQIFGFLGPNGAGKSTTIRLLLDFIRPTSGRVRVLGQEVRHAGLAIRRRVGYLSGEPALYEQMTGESMLAHAAHLREGAVDRWYVRDLAARFEADLSVPIRSLSRGNKQKIAIVHAFMHRPELLVLDEPTSGLDPLMQQEFYRLLRETTNEGRTVFMSSHILPEIDQVADRVGIIRAGTLVAIEDPSALKGRALRQVEVRFAGPVDHDGFARDLSALAGVRDLVFEDGIVRCTVEGAMDAVVKTLARYPVEDLVTAEQSLEHVFLAYYDGHGPGLGPREEMLDAP